MFWSKPTVIKLQPHEWNATHVKNFFLETFYVMSDNVMTKPPEVQWSSVPI